MAQQPIPISHSQSLQNSSAASQQLPIPSMAPGPLTKPFVLPQILESSSRWAPFTRGFGDELAKAGIDQETFIGFVDGLNVKIIPNPELLLTARTAGLAAWFVHPMIGGLSTAGGALVAGAGCVVQVRGATKKYLNDANREIFNPRSVEVHVQSTQQLNALLGLQSSPSLFGLDSTSRLRFYQDHISPLSTILPPLNEIGRRDIIAKIAHGWQNHKHARKERKAHKKLETKGKSKKANRLERKVLWLVVTNLGTLGSPGGAGKEGVDHETDVEDDELDGEEDSSGEE